MMPVLARPLPSLRQFATVAIAFAVTLTADSCARRLPTYSARDPRPMTALSVDPDLPPGNGSPRNGGAQAVDDPESEVMVTLAPGVDPVSFGQEYGATLIDYDDSGAATYAPGPGETPDDLDARLDLDP